MEQWKSLAFRYYNQLLDMLGAANLPLFSLPEKTIYVLENQSVSNSNENPSGPAPADHVMKNSLNNNTKSRKYFNILFALLCTSFVTGLILGTYQTIGTTPFLRYKIQITAVLPD